MASNVATTSMGETRDDATAEFDADPHANGRDAVEFCTPEKMVAYRWAA